ncbi:ATP-binding protein [Actinomadura scrupuli]|uniref:ATP-binding protein n=1 Tax=Actinomadura scrupuli TaxID=559629 RepID=UPI003D97EB7C
MGCRLWRRRPIRTAIADDGEGIAQADRERIFHRFFRLDSARSRDCGGTGLDFAHAHNGNLHVEDSASGGARFVLRIPLAENHEGSRPRSPWQR